MMAAIGRYWGSFITALGFNLARLWRLYIIVLAVIMLIGWGAYAALLSAPGNFPVGQTISIKKGTALPAITSGLAAEGVVRNAFIFNALIRLAGGGGRVEAGPYLFKQPANVITVARHLLTGDSGVPEVRLTIIEGASVREMAVTVAQKFPGISASDFVAAAGPYEGYLFPDTYEFAPTATPTQIAQTMNENFYTKIAPLEAQIASSTHSLSDIIIMASIVQDEANNATDQKLVAGVLWKRIAKGIALQVDAPFGYLQGRAEYSPSLADLSIDSPYNTYENKGLPPGPIGSPGLSAIEAALDPTTSNYLFYLTGHNGQMYYSATYAGQLANEKKYLN
jgi:UPF0755 protein